MSDAPINRAVLAQVVTTEAYAGARRQATRWADSRRRPIAIFVDTWRLSHRGVSRRVFRVEQSERLQDHPQWVLVDRVNPSPRTTRGAIEGVRRQDAQKRAAPWEGRENH